MLKKSSIRTDTNIRILNKTISVGSFSKMGRKRDKMAMKGQMVRSFHFWLKVLKRPNGIHVFFSFSGHTRKAISYLDLSCPYHGLMPHFVLRQWFPT